MDKLTRLPVLMRMPPSILHSHSSHSLLGKFRVSSLPIKPNHSIFFTRSINNVLGSRLTLLLGSFGYALYIGSYLYASRLLSYLVSSLMSVSAMNIHPNAGGFVIAAGAILGICAGLLWTAQGSLMLAYPTENQKGRFISIFWSIFNLGAVVGASVAVGTNFNSTVCTTYAGVSCFPCSHHYRPTQVRFTSSKGREGIS